MLLALRRGAPENATIWQRFACWVIEVRLASLYNHGGIVIDGTLYHSTAAHGPHSLPPGDWTPERWDLFDIGGDDARALAEFELACTPPRGRWQRLWWRSTRGYDTFSLLAFVGLAVRVSWLHYCFELCARMHSGEKPKERVTPEVLLLAAIKHHTTEAGQQRSEIK